MLELSNDPSSAVAVCAAVSLLVQVTVVPGATERDAGPNAKFWIVTASPPPAAGASLEAASLGPAAEAGADAAGLAPDPPHAASAAAHTRWPTNRMGRTITVDDMGAGLLAPAGRTGSGRGYARARASV